MSRIVYVNGAYSSEEDAKISIFDRGFLFGDGVYEVAAVIGAKLLDNPAHLARLRRSLAALAMPSPASDEEIVAIQRDLIARNALDQGMVYLQITRGVADRDFVFPADAAPSLVMFTQARRLIESPVAGISVAFVPDLRWRRRDVKTVCLLPASMAKMAAIAAGADDAWMVEDGLVTEGSSSNAFIITQDDAIVTRDLSNDILHGVTRRAVLRLAQETGLRFEERAFTPEEAKDAKEAFSTSASGFVRPVVRIEDRVLSNGAPGPVALRLRDLYVQTATAEAQ